MPLTEEQAKILLAKARERKPDLSRQEAQTILAEANNRVGGQEKKEPVLDMNIGDGFFKSLHKVGDVAGYGVTARNLGLLTLIGQGNASKLQEQKNQEAFLRSQELTKQAKEEKDPKKKAQLLASAKMEMEMAEVGQKAFERDLAWRLGAGDIRERDVEHPGQFALRRGVGQTVEVGQAMLPKVTGLPSATAGERILSAGVRGAVSGGLQGTSRATIDSETAGDAVGKILGGTVVGGTAGALFQAGAEGVTYAGKKVGELGAKARKKAVNFYRSTLKDNVVDKKFYQKYGGADKLIDDVIKYDISPTKNGVGQQLEEFKPEFQKIMEETIDNMDQKGVKFNMADAYKTVRKQVLDDLSYDKTLQNQARAWFDANSQYLKMTNVSPAKMREIYVDFNQNVGGLVTQDTFGQNRARKVFAQELSKRFKMFATDEGREAIEKYWLMSGLFDAMQKEPKMGIVEVAGAMVSPGTGAMNLLELLGTKLIRSPGAKRFASTNAYQMLGNAGTISQKSANIKPVEYVVNPMVSALQRMIDKEEESKQNNKLLR